MSEQIQHGPFKGQSPAKGEMVLLAYRDGTPILRDGKPVEQWALAPRTRRFLDVFPPEKGWRALIEAVPGAFNISDPDTLVTDGQGKMVMATQPTVQFNATLTNPEGIIVATASALRIINGPSAWEAGESKARSRLYDALGLTEEGGQAYDPEAAEPKPEPTKASTSSVAGVSAVEVADGRSKLPKEAQAVIDETRSASATQSQTEPAEPAKQEPNASELGASVKAPESEKQTAAGLNHVLLRQVESRAKIKGVPVPTFATNQELQDFSRSLLSNKPRAKA